MKFDSLKPNGSGSNTAAFFDTSWYDGTRLTFARFLHPYIFPMLKDDNDSRKRLELTWHYILFFKGNQVYHFKTYSETRFNEDQIEPTNDQLEGLIKGSHKHLCEWFETRRQEHPSIMEAVADLSAENVSHIVPQLREALQNQLK